MQLILNWQGDELHGEVLLKKGPSVVESGMVKTLFPQSAKLYLSPLRSRFDPPEAIQIEVTPKIEGQEVILSFPYEDPTTWLDVNVELVLQPSKGYRALLGSAKGSFLKGKVMHGTVSLVKAD
jgi:hypothetical protein